MTKTWRQPKKTVSVIEPIPAEKPKPVTIRAVMRVASKLGCEGLAHFPPDKGDSLHFVRVFTKLNVTIAAASGKSREIALRSLYAALAVLAEEA